jgi:hypothetical protein
MVDVEGFVERLREKLDQRGFAPAEAVHVVGPVNPHATPNHQAEYGEVDPVKPADGQRVLFDDDFHRIDSVKCSVLFMQINTCFYTATTASGKRVIS